MHGGGQGFDSPRVHSKRGLPKRKPGVSESPQSSRWRLCAATPAFRYCLAVSVACPPLRWGEACLAVCFEVASGEPQPMARRIAKVRVPTTIGATLVVPMATIPSPLPSSDVPNQRLARSRFPSKEKPKNPSDRKLVIEPTSISRLSRN